MVINDVFALSDASRFAQWAGWNAQNLFMQIVRRMQAAASDVFNNYIGRNGG